MPSKLLSLKISQKHQDIRMNKQKTLCSIDTQDHTCQKQIEKQTKADLI